MITTKTKRKRIFEGILVPPNDSGRATWLLESDADATKVSDDEAWFAWAEGRAVRLTVERLPIRRTRASSKKSCKLCKGRGRIRWGRPDRIGGEMGPCICTPEGREMMKGPLVLR